MFTKVKGNIIRFRDQRGVFLVEILLVIVLLAITSLWFMTSMMLSISSEGRNIRHAAALELAVDKLEELARISPEKLSDANDEQEQLVQGKMQFTRVVDVTINSDGSRTVDVNVTGDIELLGGTASLSSTFPLWGAE